MDDPSVLCLHGLGRSAEDWDAVRPGLERFGTVAAPALPRATVDEQPERWLAVVTAWLDDVLAPERRSSRA